MIFSHITSTLKSRRLSPFAKKWRRAHEKKRLSQQEALDLLLASSTESNTDSNSDVSLSESDFSDEESPEEESSAPPNPQNVHIAEVPVQQSPKVYAELKPVVSSSPTES